MGDTDPATFTDAAGVIHAPIKTARLVSLVPSLTELVCDLGLADQLVGRTAYCVHPRQVVRAIPAVGGTKRIHLERIKALAPTHIIVNVDETPRPLAEELARLGYHVVVTHPNTVHDNIALYRLIGGLFDRPREAKALTDRLADRLHAMTRAAQDWPARRVLYLIWKNPWMTVSRQTYIGDLLALARLHVVEDAADQRYPVITLNDSLLDQVDWVLFASEPFRFRDRHLAAFNADHPRHGGKARLIDGEMLSWYGSRAIRGIDYLRDFVATLPDPGTRAGSL